MHASRRIERERRWIRAAFGGALLAAGAPALLLAACTNRETTPAGTGGAGGTTLDGGHDSPGADADASARHDADASGDADAKADVSCAETLSQLDATVPDGGPDADLLCRVHLPCGVPEGTGVMGCTLFESMGDARATFGCNIVDDGACEADAADPHGDLTVDCPCDLFMAGGRRPFGARVRPARARAGDGYGAWLAAMAHEEAASVGAFERLAEELAEFGAPDELVVAAARSAADEVRHAATFARLARARGAEPSRTPEVRRGARGLEAMARENAVEGCVRETYAALLAHAQAARTPDPGLRRALERIAADETRHAALAWAVARWADSRLDRAARARVVRARQAAARRLAVELGVEPPRRLASAAGLPDASIALTLHRALSPRWFAPTS